MFLKYPVLQALQLVDEKHEAHSYGQLLAIVVLFSKYPSSGTQRFDILLSFLKCNVALQEVQ